MKTVVITGISRGIGKATAEKFLNEGWRIIGISKTGNSPIQHHNLEVQKIDISKPESINVFIEQFNKSDVRIDVLINNAGISIDQGQSISMEILRKTLEVNLIGLIDLTEQLLPKINDGGYIINLSSGLGSLADATSGNYPSYRISKVAVNMYTRTISARLIDRNITVCSVDPGWVKTDMGGAGATRKPSEPAKEIYEMVTSKIDSGYFWHKGKKKSW